MTDDLVPFLRTAKKATREQLERLCAKSADRIEALTAERDALQADNARLRAAMQAAIDIGIIPKSSALDGGANRHSAEIRVADQFRAALNTGKEPSHE